MSKHKLTPWRPLPSGAIIAVFVGPSSLLLLVCAVLFESPLSGVLSLVLGVWAVYSACDASYVAGMRRMADSKRDLE